ncbi:uncharacterized protein LOC107361580 [Tetranychus urticae]|uniref:Uncharacterized protein n=1 Tax=Tetranychus urticae TaxID=32264 RepID=T1K8D7_TETUR|nr:uncharacterized protein LOC107361580 [Tetranychus urticae]
MLSSKKYFETIEEASVESFNAINIAKNNGVSGDDKAVKTTKSLELFKICYNLVTIIGFLWQVYSVNYIYLQYNTVVNIIVSKMTHYNMPGITICLDYDMEDKETFKLFYPDHNMDNYSPDDLRLIFLQTPIHSIYRNAHTVGRVSINCTVKCSRDSRFVKPSSSFQSTSFDSASFCVDIPCSIYSKPIETLSWARNNVIRRCTTYFTWNSTSTPLREYSEDGRELIEFNVASNGSAVVIFAMHSGKTLPWTEREDFSSLDIDRYRRFTIDYSVIIFELLPRPYKTNCSHYIEYGVFGRTYCVHSCERSMFRRERGTWPLDVPAPVNTSLSFFPHGSGLRRERAFPLKTFAACSKSCIQPECSSYIITFTTKNQDFIPNHDNKTQLRSSIFVNRPRSYAISYIHSPAINFIEYFTYISGSFSLWFGLSALSIFNVLPRICEGNKKPMKRPIAVDKLDKRFWQTSKYVNGFYSNYKHIETKVIFDNSMDLSHDSNPTDKSIDSTNPIFLSMISTGRRGNGKKHSLTTVFQTFEAHRIIY